MDNFGPIMLIEVFVFFGGMLLFVWWQLNDIQKDREKDQKKEEQDT